MLRAASNESRKIYSKIVAGPRLALGSFGYEPNELLYSTPQIMM